MIGQFGIVYLPIEFGSREFESKLLVAAVLLSRGYPVVIGQQWLIYSNINRLPPGVVLFKSFNTIHHAAMQAARKAGHVVVILEEELLAHIEERAIRNFCAKGVFELPHLILTNGEFEKEVLRKQSNSSVPIEVAGNGRIDLLKAEFRDFYRDEIDRITGLHGDFILINTNFGITNTIWDSLGQVTQIHVQAGFVNPSDPSSVRDWRDQINFEVNNKKALLAAIANIASRLPTQTIVIRPHPGEALEKWHGVFANFPNVCIVREGPHVPWTLASRLLIHTSCTTGFEAAAAGKVALSLVAEPNWLSDSFISNKLNPVFMDPMALADTAIRLLEGRNDGGDVPEQNEFDATYYVWNYKSKFAAGRIADLLTSGLVPYNSVAIPSLTQIHRPDKLRNKFEISLQSFVASLAKLRKILGHQGAVEASSLGDSLFVVKPR